MNDGAAKFFGLEIWPGNKKVLLLHHCPLFAGEDIAARRTFLLSPRQAVLRRHSTKIPPDYLPSEKVSSGGIFLTLHSYLRAAGHNAPNLAPKTNRISRRNALNTRAKTFSFWRIIFSEMAPKKNPLHASF